MESVRRWATTHYDCVVHRGDLLPRMLSDPVSNAAAARTASAEEEEQGELALALRHLIVHAGTQDTAVDVASHGEGGAGSGAKEGAGLEALRQLRIDVVAEALGRFRHHGALHILYSNANTAQPRLATVACPAQGAPTELTACLGRPRK